MKIKNNLTEQILSGCAMLFVMLSVITVICIMVVKYCNRNKLNEHKFVYNINMRIVKINSDCSLTDDKFHNPQLCNTILFETIKGEKLYREINTCNLNLSSDIHIDTKWLYNHRVGDTVHFDYLKKSEFFKIIR